MTIATLSQVLTPALRNNYAVAGLVTLGWEDMVAYVQAAEALGVPVILQAGPSCRKHTPLPVLAKMFRHLAEQATVPVVGHLDHAYTLEECKIAIDCGFTSIMYDGSRKPFSQNCDETARVTELAHAAGVSAEGEIGFVGYADGEHSNMTDPEEAAQFAHQTKIDAMAISVGNVHLQREIGTEIDFIRLRAIEALTPVPLVLHGGSGIAPKKRRELAQTTHICKFNIGTELRQTFGKALYTAVTSQPERFDRNAILRETIDPLALATQTVLKSMGHKTQLSEMVECT